MITTEEERREANGLGWRLFGLGGEFEPFEIWCLDDEVSETTVKLVLVDGRRELVLYQIDSMIGRYLSHIIHLAAIFQIPIPGFKILREEGAQP